MQNPKYKEVREKLDRLKYLDHLGEDSVKLVERLVNDYTKLLDTYTRLMKKS